MGGGDGGGGGGGGEGRNQREEAEKQIYTRTHTHNTHNTHTPHMHTHTHNTHTHTIDLRCCKVQNSLCLQTCLSVREGIEGVFAMVTASTTVTNATKGEGVHCNSVGEEKRGAEEGRQ